MVKLNLPDNFTVNSPANTPNSIPDTPALTTANTLNDHCGHSEPKDPIPYTFTKPQHLEDLAKADPLLIDSSHFRQCLFDTIIYYLSNGVPDHQCMHPDEYFKGDEDLKLFSSVVSQFPNAARWKPDLSAMADHIRTAAGSQRRTFAEWNQYYKELAIKECIKHSVDPENPNETPEERRRRKQREYMKRYRETKKQAQELDPQLQKLEADVLAAKHNHEQGKRWFKMKSTESSIARDNAIAAARAEYDAAMLSYMGHVDLAEKQYREALLAREQYIANKQ